MKQDIRKVIPYSKCFQFVFNMTSLVSWYFRNKFNGIKHPNPVNTSTESSRIVNWRYSGTCLQHWNEKSHLKLKYTKISLWESNLYTNAYVVCAVILTVVFVFTEDGQISEGTIGCIYEVDNSKKHITPKAVHSVTSRCRLF